MTTRKGHEDRKQFINQGAYGAVYSKGNNAYKHFRKLNALVQEFAAGAFLRGCKNIVTIKKAHYDTLRLKMELYQKNLRLWMADNHTHGQKRKVFSDLLVALTEIHRRDIVHGDIKPGNILINENNKGEPTCYLGDLGFVSISKFSKVRRTTEAYRDKLMLANSGHDLYSLGLVVLELFADVRVKRQVTHEEIKEEVKKSIKDTTIAAAIIGLTDPDYRKRPSAEDLLNRIFGYDPTVHLRKWPEDRKRVPDESKFKEVEGWVREVSKKYEINRAKRGFRCLIIFFAEEGVNKSDYPRYTAAMLMILASLFGKSGFDERVACKWADCKYDNFLPALASLLSNSGIISGLLNP